MNDAEQDRWKSDLVIGAATRLRQFAAEGWEMAVLAALNAGDDEKVVAVRYNTTVAVVQDICGDDGHDWEDYDSSSPLGISCWRACVRCGAPDDDGGEP